MCEGVFHIVIDINKAIYGVFTKIDDLTFKSSQGESDLYMTILGSQVKVTKSYSLHPKLFLVKIRSSLFWKVT